MCMEKNTSEDLHHEELHRLPDKQENIIRDLIKGKYIVEGHVSDVTDAKLYFEQLVERSVDTYEAGVAITDN